MSGAQVAFWDFDGTLARRPGMWRACLRAALDRVQTGHGVTDEQLRPGLRGGFPWHVPDVHHLDVRTAEAWWDRLMPLFVRAYEAAGVAPTTAIAAARLVPELYSDPASWEVFADARPALALLRERGWRHVVVSNHVPELPALVSDLGLGDLFDDVITSAAVGYEKPHPAIFRAAMDRVPGATRTVMVGDDPIADVAGAEAAGLRALLVRDASAHGLLWAADRILEIEWPD